MVQIAVGWGGEFESAEADVVECFVVDAESLICVLDKLVHGESGVVRLDDSVGDFWGGNNRVGVHHSVGVLFADFGDQERSHTRSGSSTK